MSEQNDIGAVKQTPEAMRESLRTIPSSVEGHKHPTMQPVGDKAMTGGNYN